MFAISCHDDDQESPLKAMTLVITQQPANATGVIGGQAVFAATFITNAPGSTTYQWQIQTNAPQGSWIDLVETTGYYEGVATTTLTVKAIDNYLATRNSLNFRCVATYMGIPTFTSTAVLSIPIHTDWTPRASCGGNGDASTGLITTDPIAAPVCTGLTGPLTYLWSYVSGETLTCSDVTAASPTFDKNFGAPTGNPKYSFWKCTITDGTNTVDTDPLLILLAMQDGYGYQDDAATPGPFSLSGSAIDTIRLVPLNLDDAQFDQYAIVMQRKFRNPAAVSWGLVTQISGNLATVAFTNGGNSAGGTANACVIYAYLKKVSNPFLFDSVFAGSDGLGLGTVIYALGGPAGS